MNILLKIAKEVEDNRELLNRAKDMIELLAGELEAEDYMEEDEDCRTTILTAYRLVKEIDEATTSAKEEG